MHEETVEKRDTEYVGQTGQHERLSCCCLSQALSVALFEGLSCLTNNRVNNEIQDWQWQNRSEI